MYLQVLLPDNVNTTVGARLPLLFALPVEANIPQGNDEPKQDAGHYGNGLLEIQKADFHNRAQHIVATMEFHDTPWFADNTNGTVMQESYILHTIIPILQLHFNASKDVKLIGFSKSGWGALTLLARNPFVFTMAAVWDAPLMLADWTDIDR
jgi:hypothetical protein